uniref:Uncharacterized protein n=1 Tax=Globodera rostochiensis TaxID=31243 RepID=A0A914I2G4_GLORO
MKTIYMNALFTLFFVLFKLQIVDSHWKWHDFWDNDSSSSLSSNEEQQYKPKSVHSKPKIREERRTLDQLYAAALKEGGRVIVYAGGDTAGQLDWTKMAFERRFPNITMDVVVDYSKFHVPRIDYQLAKRSLVPDVVQLQSLHEFPRWKEMGVLMPYKPAGWNAIYKDYRDSDGYFTGIVVFSFSNVVNSKKLVITYPTDDDAVLFWFKQVVDKYGLEWVIKLAKQEPIWVRGTEAPADLVENGTALATMSTVGLLIPDNTTAAIFKDAKHPEAAKLYMNWSLDKKSQANQWSFFWSVRTDVPAPAGYRRSWEYPHLTSHKAFADFLEDREAAERFRHQLFLFLGEAQGPPSPGYPGIFPDKALPH